MDLRRKAVAMIWACVLVAVAQLPASAAEWEQYLADDFVSAETMFYTGPAGSAFYAIDENGQYVIDGLASNVDSLSALTDNLYFYYAEAQCEVTESTAGELAFAGLVFHYNKRVKPGEYSYYVFYIYSDGYYGAKRVMGDQVEIVLPLTRTDLIDPLMPNVLAVDAQGTHFDLYINGRYVDGFTDVRIDGGGFGFYISKNTKGIFDNFVVKVERRETGQDQGAQPQPSGANGVDSSFNGYAFPQIPRDPNRPLYPWEVGVNKTGKEPKPEPPADDPPEEPAGGDEGSGDEGSASDASGSAGSGEEQPSVPPGEVLVDAAQPEGAKPPPPKQVDPSEIPPVPERHIADSGDASAVILVPASELIQQHSNGKEPAPEKPGTDGAAKGKDDAKDEELPPIDEILGNLKPVDDGGQSAGGQQQEPEDETYTAPKDLSDLSLFPEELTGDSATTEGGEDGADESGNGGMLAGDPRAVAGAGGGPKPPAALVTTIDDDFTERNWPESQDEFSNYSYFGDAYQIDNLAADTMAISFKKGDFGDAEVAVDAEYLDGRANVGFGLGARFRVDGGSVSYYGLFIAGSGEFLLLKVVNGQETVLKDWTRANMISPDGPNSIKLELVGSTINAYVNGALVTTVRDSSIRSGGYAMLAGPGLAARYDNFHLRGVTAEDSGL